MEGGEKPSAAPVASGFNFIPFREGETALMPPPSHSHFAGVVELAFRLPDGGRESRRFATSAPCSQLYRFVASGLALPPRSVISISTSFPRKVRDPIERRWQREGGGRF